MSSLWRDIKVYADHAFIVSEASGHGMQVFDLTKLRNVPNPPITFSSDAHYGGFGNCHNIAINEESGRAYPIGANTFSGGLNIIDISNPLTPTLIGSFAEDGYSHDAQIVNYIGPDAQYAGKEIAFCFNENTVTIVDVTDAGDPVLLSATGYSTSAYTHQGWLTEDHKYLLVGDELDEGSVNTRTYIFDVQDLNNVSLIGTHVGATAAIDHNMYTHEGLVYQSNYRAGLEILDLDNVGQGQLERVAYFDVYPASNSAQFNGTWSNYPYFASGNVIVSHIEEGLFVLRPNITPPCLEDCGCTDATACNYDPNALNDDGTCDFSCYGCTDPTACNYDATATIDDGSCTAPDPQFGCECSISGSQTATLSGTESSAPLVVDAIANPSASSIDITLTFTGQGSSWPADMAMSITDGDGNCIAFGGYNDSPAGCPSLGGYQAIWPSSLGRVGQRHLHRHGRPQRGEPLRLRRLERGPVQWMDFGFRRHLSGRLDHPGRPARTLECPMCRAVPMPRPATSTPRPTSTTAPASTTTPSVSVAATARPTWTATASATSTRSGLHRSGGDELQPQRHGRRRFV